MKQFIALLSCFFILLTLCACNNSSTEIENLKKEIEVLKQENESLRISQNEDIANDESNDDSSDDTNDSNIFAMSDNQNTVSDSQEKDVLSVIWEFVQPEIAENLKQPTTAEFTDISKVKFYEISKDTYEVLGTVKGQNALGNLVSNNFCSTVIIDSKGQPTMVSTVEFLSDTNFDERISLNEQIKERTASGKKYLTADELAEETEAQPLYVSDTEYIDSSDLRYSSYSMLQAVLYNNSDVPIKSVVIAFVAWDQNGLPIRIEKYSSSSSASYFSKVNYAAINLMPGETYTGKDGDTYSGMQIDGNLDISHLKAIVVSYEDFDGNSWDNPLILDFKHLYEEKRLLD